MPPPSEVSCGKEAAWATRSTAWGGIYAVGEDGADLTSVSEYRVIRDVNLVCDLINSPHRTVFQAEIVGNMKDTRNEGRGGVMSSEIARLCPPPPLLSIIIGVFGALTELVRGLSKRLVLWCIHSIAFCE